MTTQHSSLKKGAEPPPPIFGPFLLRPNGWMHQDQDATWYGGRPQLRRLCVRWGPSSWRSPQFSASIYCGQTVGCIKMPLGTEVGLSLDVIVLDGDATSPLLKGHSPQFSASVSCSQTAGWTKMPPGMEVGLGPGNFCLLYTSPSPRDRQKSRMPSSA